MAKLLNLRNKPTGEYIRIDRATKWGNPFKIGKHGDRKEVIIRYEEHLRTLYRQKIVTLEDLAGLHGHDLACWCTPLPCHGEVLMRAAKWANKKLKSRK